MYGKFFTLFGMISMLIGLVVLIIWLFTYSGEQVVIERGIMVKEHKGGMTFIVGYFLTLIGLISCTIGFIRTAENTSVDIELTSYKTNKR